MANRSWERWMTAEEKAFNILYEETFNFLKSYYTEYNQDAIQNCLDERVQDFNQKIKLCKDAGITSELVDYLQDGGNLYDFLEEKFDKVYKPKISIWEKLKSDET